jgi:ATP-dependent DNA helicase RecG
MKENQNTEWKESWRDEYLRWVCGFANAEGGVLVIGRNDKGVAVGVKGAAKLMEDIPNKVRDILGIMVDVNLVGEAGKELLEIHVEPYPSPVSYKGEYHYRSGSTKQELKGAALSQFLLRKQGLHWDAVPVPGLSLADCHPAAFKMFRSNAAKSGRVDDQVLADSDAALLASLQLEEGAYLKRATALLFGAQPERFVPGAFIKIGFFVTDDDLRYQTEVRGNLFLQVEAALDHLRTKYLKAYISYEGLHRLETFLFPLQALREALLNAVIHKDYSSGVPIQISVYEHQVVIWNPGQLPERWTLEKLLGKHPSSPFNPLLASAFFRAGYVESWGRGIEKIDRECRAHGMAPPAYDSSMSGLMLTFKANPAHLAAALGHESVTAPVETPVETRAETPTRILAALAGNPGMTLAQVANVIGKSSSAVERATAKLVSQGRLRFVGPRKGGRWEVLK